MKKALKTMGQIKTEFDTIPRDISEAKIMKMLLKLQADAEEAGLGPQFRRLMVDDLKKRK